MELNGDLTVFAANAASVGMYTCVASNSVGSDSGQVEVIVRGNYHVADNLQLGGH